MKLVRILVLAALVGGAYTPSAHAFFLSGNELYERCQTKSAYCIATVTAYDDMANTLAAKAYCVTGNVTGQQLVDVFLNRARDNPQERHRAAVNIFLRAMSGAFPC